MNTNVIILIIVVVVVVLAVIAYFFHKKDTYIPGIMSYISPMEMSRLRAMRQSNENLLETTPLKAARNKGYMHIVDFLINQANSVVVPNARTAQETVYLINHSPSEADALKIIQTMYWPRVGASANVPVPISNYHPFGGV